MIELKQYQESHFDNLNSYHLDEIQSNFTRGFNYCIADRKDLEDAHKTVMTILYEGHPVGFFVLDTGADKLKYTDNPASILIRSLSLNPQYQGKGVGKQAMKLVPGYVKENFGNINEVVLAVNINNKNAYWVYRKAGFIDDGKVVEGRKGPLHVLTKSLI